MSIIFFDLETSDREFCGQILNYSFIRTNNQFEIEDELNGDIALSVLQIPSPGALLTNRVRILDHQKQNFPREPEAMLSIVDFIAESLTNSKDQVYLSGYNSTRFDLPYLRTSLIRNGLNPYFSGKLKYCDVLHLVRKAYLCNESFPDSISEKEPNRVSLSLETVAKVFGLLSGVQSHHSRADVILTINLCRELHIRFGLHPAKFNPYEAVSTDTAVVAMVPNYDNAETPNRFLDRHLGLLSETYRGSLWVDLERYAAGDGRASISWFNKNGGLLLKNTSKESSSELLAQLEKARLEFPELTPDNFFPKSSCDIEQDIYRLDMQKITTLGLVIWQNERALLGSIKDSDLQDLISRYWLAYGLSPDKRGDKWREKLRRYSEKRYGKGTFQLVKSLTADLVPEKAALCYHPSLSEISEMIAELLDTRAAEEDREILTQLKNYIEDSEIRKSLTELSVSLAPEPCR